MRTKSLRINGRLKDKGETGDSMANVERPVCTTVIWTRGSGGFYCSSTKKTTVFTRSGVWSLVFESRVAMMNSKLEDGTMPKRECEHVLCPSLWLSQKRGHHLTCLECTPHTTGLPRCRVTAPTVTAGEGEVSTYIQDCLGGARAISTGPAPEIEPIPKPSSIVFLSRG